MGVCMCDCVNVRRKEVAQEVIHRKTSILARCRKLGRIVVSFHRFSFTIALEGIVFVFLCFILFFFCLHVFPLENHRGGVSSRSVTLKTPRV